MKDGLVVIDKPSGLSSFLAVNITKRSLKVQKAGHMGTLDPLAEGVLPLAVGKSTRLFDYLLDKQKVYIAEFTFGYE
ncbi:MAG: tRNA pseudouridine(55) synthase TruB, partial [Clostridia bacterium]|nr:tRNA pseudouridine(55) synthase TruB [Clostridia bacterium]